MAERHYFIMAAGYMRKGIRAACILLYVVFLSLGVFPQRIFSQEEDAEEKKSGSQTIPNALRRPDRGEAPRYPQDLVIGELGQGKAPDGAYRFARDFLDALAKGNRDAPAVEDSLLVLGGEYMDEILDNISSLEPRTYRLGGGRTEADGSVSFLVRFLGTQESITGELFIRRQENEKDPDSGELQSEENPGTKSRELLWYLDDLILEERRALTEIRDSYRYDFSPYERFF